MPNKTKLGRNIGPFHTNAFSFENEYISMSLDLPTALIRGALSTLMRFQKYALSLSSKTHRSIRVYTTVLMCFWLSTQKRSKTIEWHVGTSVELCAHSTKHAPAIFYNQRGTYDVIDFILMPFRRSTPIRFFCVFVLIHFQQRFEVNAFSMKTLSVLVWTGCL